jgi:hypothetical protein
LGKRAAVCVRACKRLKRSAIPRPRLRPADRPEAVKQVPRALPCSCQTAPAEKADRRGALTDGHAWLKRATMEVMPSMPEKSSEKVVKSSRLLGRPVSQTCR